MPDVILNGPEGRIEGRYHHVRSGPAPMALVLHPHPLHGGNMNNRVVYTLYQNFVKRGFSSRRASTTWPAMPSLLKLIAAKLMRT